MDVSGETLTEGSLLHCWMSDLNDPVLLIPTIEMGSYRRFMVSLIVRQDIQP